MLARHQACMLLLLFHCRRTDMPGWPRYPPNMPLALVLIALRTVTQHQAHITLRNTASRSTPSNTQGCDRCNTTATLTRPQLLQPRTLPQYRQLQHTRIHTCCCCYKDCITLCLAAHRPCKQEHQKQATQPCPSTFKLESSCELFSSMKPNGLHTVCVSQCSRPGCNVLDAAHTDAANACQVVAKHGCAPGVSQVGGQVLQRGLAGGGSLKNTQHTDTGKHRSQNGYRTWG